MAYPIERVWIDVGETIWHGTELYPHVSQCAFFTINSSEDMIVDTLVFYAFASADVQLHFHGIDPNHAVEYLYNIASYQFESEFAVINGDTIDGIDNNGRIQPYIQWRMQYEDSLIQPIRTVLDINCGEFAAGSRK